MLESELDAAHDGHVAAYTELLKDEQFRYLVGCLATVYAVTNRRVTSIDQRSFRSAKEHVQKFCARTSGYKAAVSRSTRNGSWRRGALDANSQEQGWKDKDDEGSLGGRSGRLRSQPPQLIQRLQPAQAESAAADTEVAVSGTVAQPLPAGPRDKSRCPGCSARTVRVWHVKTPAYSGACCPACVRKRTRGEP